MNEFALALRSWRVYGLVSGSITGDQGFARPTPADLDEKSQDVLRAGIYLRERDLSYSHFEHQDNMRIRCVLLEGEIPCIYSIHLEDKPGTKPPDATINVAFLALVDIVSGTTGAGVGIALKKPPASSQLSTDLRTGRRVRYQISEFPHTTTRPEDIYWVERTETGRSRSSTSSAGINFG